MKKSGLLFMLSLFGLFMPTALDDGYIDVRSNASVLNTDVQDLIDSFCYVQDDVNNNTFYASEYFSNLKTNFPYNTHGTCSYVALSMFLSFYDTYWDDSIIPEIYEENTFFESITPIEYEFELVPFGTESPGIKSESYHDLYELSDDEYLDFVDDTENTYFQSHLIQLSELYFGTAKFDTSSNPFGMTYGELLGFTQHYLSSYSSLIQDFTMIRGFNSSPSLARNMVIYELRQGNPVLLRATSDNLGAHAMVAYDYDEDTDEIYVHTGWKDMEGRSLSHVSLEQLGFDTIVDGFAITILTAHQHSYHFHSSRNEVVCACSFAHPRGLHISGGNYRDMLPTFSWESLKGEEWFSHYNPHFDLEFLNGNRNLLFTIEPVNQNFYSLAYSEWHSILNQISSETYFVCISLHSLSYPYWDDYYCVQEFSKPSTYQQIPTFSPAEYLFSNEYVSSEVAKTEYVSHTTQNGFSFKTRRYRVKSDGISLILSPKKAGFTEAFIEYKFTVGITRLDIELSFYNSQQLEGLDQSNGKAFVEYHWGDNYVGVKDLLSEEENLPSSPFLKRMYTICFDHPVYRLRVWAETDSANANTDDKGRICIGNVSFYEDPDSFILSGSELEYQPDLWNATGIMSTTNCYSYALNAKTNPDPFWYGCPMDPGQSVDPIQQDQIPNSSILISKIIMDSNNYGFSFSPVGKYSQPSGGCYKVALVVDPINTSNTIFANDKDYHWYRQNEDGTWSHKPSTYAIMCKDWSDKIIADPECCNRRISYKVNYEIFVGFFSVSPIQ